MYKSTQDQGDYFNRVASHATKPSRRGIIRDIPAWAKEPEEYYNSLLEQHDTLMTRLHDTRERVIWLRKQLKATLPFETYERLQHELDFATPLLVDLEQQSGLSRAAVRSAANNAWGAVFYFLAAKQLPGEIFRALDKATQELLQCQHQELAKGATERSAEYRRARNRTGHLKDRRDKVREAMSTGTYRSPPVGKTYHAGPPRNKANLNP
jgi:hypothetical protein